MADNKKYYYLKLKDNFFDSDATIVLESMPDGYLYSNILLKLYLRSLKNDGKLMFNDRIPYNPTILAQVTRHNVGVVEKALNIFQELDLIEIMDNGAIYMLDIQNFIGESSTEADRIRGYRNKIKAEKEGIALPDGTNVRTNVTDKSVQMYDESTPEIDIEKEKEKEKETEIEIDTEEETSSLGSQILLSNNLKEKIISEWNALPLTKIKGITSIRVKKLKTLLRNYSEEDILTAINNINESDFLKGINDTGWTIQFDWFLKPNNFIKVLEGNYQSSKQQKSTKEKEKSIFDCPEYDEFLLNWKPGDGTWEELLEREGRLNG